MDEELPDMTPPPLPPPSRPPPKPPRRKRKEEYLKVSVTEDQTSIASSPPVESNLLSLEEQSLTVLSIDDSSKSVTAVPEIIQVYSTSDDSTNFTVNHPKIDTHSTAVAKRTTNPFDDEAQGDGDNDGDNGNNTGFNPFSKETESPIAKRIPIDENCTLTDVKTLDKRPQSLKIYYSTYNWEMKPDAIYCQSRFSMLWLLLTIAFHVLQFSFLINIGFPFLSTPVNCIIIVISVTVVGLLLYSRSLVTITDRKRKGYVSYNDDMSPEIESDDIPPVVVKMLAIAVVLEGVLYALYSSTVSSDTEKYSSGVYSMTILLQSLGFASITLLGYHQILRPANRIDPMRTLMELEVVSVCWDALDGSTLFELLAYQDNVPPALSVAIKIVMAFWYVSVGVRIAIMYLVHLPPTDNVQKLLVARPLSLAPQPTVDRTLQAIRLRCVVLLSMSISEIAAAIIRIVLWIQYGIDSLQQEMCLKNILFLISIISAYYMWSGTVTRNWNDRELGFGLKIPNRLRQISIYMGAFIIAYLLIGGLMAGILMQVTAEKYRWYGSIILDCILVTLFYIYCRNIHIQTSVNDRIRFFPQRGFTLFPRTLCFCFSSLLAVNLYGVRLPYIYYHYNTMMDAALYGSMASYSNALIIVTLSAVPIIAASSFFSISYMMFRKEFTACPGNYNAIHDPIISMVCTSTIVEGVMDIISCTQFMALAGNDLPPQVDGIVIIFCFLEVVNACQSIAFPVFLSGGYDDRPQDLVRYKAYMRGLRFAVDFGSFFLRLALWVHYGAVGSVFIIKNLFSLLHAGNQVERYAGSKKYKEGIQFNQFVLPQDWYGLTKEEWRNRIAKPLNI